MTDRMKTAIAATVIGLGLAATPALAQTVGPDRGFAAARATGQTVEGYQPDGRVNVWGARLEPTQGAGPLGGIVGGATGLVGDTLSNTVGAADGIVTGSVAPRGAPAGAGRGY